SEVTKRDLIELYGLPEEKIVVTPLAADPIYTPEGPSPDGEPYVLFVSALQPRKEPVTAIEGMSLLGVEAPRLVLVGPDKGSRADAESAAQRLGVDVQLRGHVERGELAALYRGAQCLVFPSRYEGFGLPVLEAMSLGTPVLSADAASLPEVVGDAGRLIDPGDADAWRQAMLELLDDSDERERLVAAGLERVGEFSWATTAGETLAAYRAALADGGSAGADGVSDADDEGGPGPDDPTGEGPT
ncbi:MAG: glycosyltransferase family 4 protein, partial [Acidimicrobiales bacterium]